MRGALAVMAVSAIGLAGCADTSFNSERTVFNNPYLPLDLENGPVGPACDEGVLRDDRCWIDGKAYPVSNRFARAANGDLIRLSRADRDFLRERQETVDAKRDVLESLENGTPIPEGSPALRTNQNRPVPLPDPADERD